MIYYNAIRTPDGTVIESKHRHDFVSHKDANGNIYAVDGGRDYARRVGNSDYEELSVDDTSPHKEIREAFTWGTYGKDGTDKLEYVKLKDMSQGHILAIKSDKFFHILDTLFDNELQWRLDNEV